MRAVVRKALPVLGYHRIVFIEASLNPRVAPPPAGIPLTFEFLGRGDASSMAAFRPDLPRDEFERRLDEGERCFVARSNGAVVGAYWVHRHDVAFPELGRVLVVPEGAVYVCDAFVGPAMRGQRIAPSLSRELKNRLAAEGFERWVGFVLGGNDAGLKNARRGGSRETSRVAALKLGPLPPIRAPYLPRHG